MMNLRFPPKKCTLVVVFLLDEISRHPLTFAGENKNKYYVKYFMQVDICITMSAFQ